MVAANREADVRGWYECLSSIQQMLLMNMTPAALAKHVLGMIVTWTGIVVSAQRADGASYGGPDVAALWFFVVGLIPVGLLYIEMFDGMLKDKKFDEERAKNDERWARYDERMDRMEAMMRQILNNMSAPRVGIN